MARALAGEDRPELIAAALRDGTRIAGAVVVVLDINLKTRALEQLSEARQDLEGRVTEEVKARQAAQARLAQAEKLTALGQLAGGVAHDSNNVLQVFSSGANLIGMRADDPSK